MSNDRLYNRAEDRRLFYRNHPTVTFKKGETILFQDEIPKYVYGIKSGVVKESNITDNGSRQSISINVTDDIIPKCWAFSKTNKLLFDYFAFTDCELYVIDKTTFQSHLENNIHFANQVIGRLMDSLIGARLQIDALEKPHARMKLLYIFRYFCLLYGKNLENDMVIIQIPLTQQDIADFTSLTRETTSTELNMLKNAKIISRHRKYYTVNVTKLNNEINDEYDPGVSVNVLSNNLNKKIITDK